MADQSELLLERANNLKAADLNGLKRVFVRLLPSPNPKYAELELVFFNENGLADLDLDGRHPKWMFPISGGFRLQAGPGTDQVQVSGWQAGSDSRSLILTVQPIGDYSTYSLSADFDWIDPVFGELEFKFRPGCFNTSCGQEWDAGIEAPAPPAIDYMARDFKSFRAVAIDAMMKRVPHWEPTSDADLDVVLLELFSAVGDELADFQDRIMNEAWVTRARRRISLARHCRLMDYHIHQGNQADTWLVLTAKPGFVGTQAAGLTVCTESDPSVLGCQFFSTRAQALLDHRLNVLDVYTWSHTRDRLVRGSTRAELAFGSDHADALNVRDLILDRSLKTLLIQEERESRLGTVTGRNPNRRQILTLSSVAKDVFVKKDPLTKDWYLRVTWLEPLQETYILTASPVSGMVDGVSRLYGNLIQAYHGSTRTSTYRDSGEPLLSERESHYYLDGSRGTVCPLIDRYLAYHPTPLGGHVAPSSTLEVRVWVPGQPEQVWTEVISLTRSGENERNFLVETDENGFSLLRFGNGNNGMPLPAEARIEVRCQVGRPLDGNVGSETLNWFDPNQAPQLETVRNPFGASSGRAPEDPAQIIRSVGEAWSQRQRRAITLDDYRQRAEEVPGVLRACAFYGWTGSYRSVRIAIDPLGTTQLSDQLRQDVYKTLEPLRLIGEDLEVRAPDYVPLEITLRVCLKPGVSANDTRYLLEQAFGSGYDPSGKAGFFHLDRWSFGQSLHASKIAAVAQVLPGIAHLSAITMRRVFAKRASRRVIHAGKNEILLVRNDPNSMEEGYIFFEFVGGR